MDTSPELGPPIRRIFRDVIADRMPAGQRPPVTKLLFEPWTGPSWDDRCFLGDFYNEILHQDTCLPGTADGVPVLVELAVDNRVPPDQRFGLIGLLLSIATAGDRHIAESWPDTPPHWFPDSVEQARCAVENRVLDLLARWPVECAGVRLALAGLAAVFATERTLPALAPRLEGFLDTEAGDYVRFVLVVASRREDRIHEAVETITEDAYWRSTFRDAPNRGRALHLLDQMITRVGVSLLADHLR